ncbi:gp19.5 family protein [Pseudomonas aeruginosa]|uniref:gp19.5 family protein n=1 Tax=Pseudomonas aeruginosa TaxID=287 RepID=UPI001C8ECA8F
MAVIRTLAIHHVTYRFLGVLLVTLGINQGGHLVESFGDVVCVLLGGCVEWPCRGAGRTITP